MFHDNWLYETYNGEFCLIYYYVKLVRLTISMTHTGELHNNAACICTWFWKAGYSNALVHLHSCPTILWTVKTGSPPSHNRPGFLVSVNTQPPLTVSLTSNSCLLNWNLDLACFIFACLYSICSFALAFWAVPQLYLQPFYWIFIHAACYCLNLEWILKAYMVKMWSSAQPFWRWWKP